jgi:hypothetical protein
MKSNSGVMIGAPPIGGKGCWGGEPHPMSRRFPHWSVKQPDIASAARIVKERSFGGAPTVVKAASTCRRAGGKPIDHCCCEVWEAPKERRAARVLA